MKKILLLLIVGIGLHAVKPATDSYQLYLLANYESAQDHTQQAFTYWQKLFKQPTASPYAYSGFIRFLFATGQYQAIVSLQPVIDQLFADDSDIQLLAAIAMLQGGKQAEGDNRLITLQQKHKTNAELTYQAAIAYGRKQNFEKALQVVDEYLNAVPNQPRNCLFFLLKSQLYMNLNNKTKALEQVKKSIEQCPSFDKSWLLLGIIQEEAGKIEEAITGYKTFLELAGPNKEVEQQLTRLLIQSKLAPTQARIEKKPSSIVNAMTWYENKEYDRALVAIEHHLKEQPEDTEGKLLKVHILSAIGRMQEVMSDITEWLFQSPEKETWYQVLHLLSHAGLPSHQLIALYKKIEHKHPRNALPKLYLADVYTQHGDYAQALSYHDAALALVADQRLKAKILFNKGLIYYRIGKYKEMKNALEEGKKYDASFAPLLNLLAYYYATKGRDLTAAETLITQALALDPSNPHYQDTQAVIWYKQREYDRAVDLLTRLVKLQPQDYFIHKHLAQVYSKLGNTKLAVANLQKAATLARTEQEKEQCKKKLKNLQK